jgi:ATP-dependent Lon protease
LGIKDEMFEKRDIHIHVPDGATPKDGPSAGAAMTTAFVSALTGIPVRADVAMTGEITLRGEVTAIGGLKEKLLAALRGGVKTVLIPEENVKDLQDIPENAKNNLEIVPVRWIDNVLEVALERVPQPLPDDESWQGRDSADVPGPGQAAVAADALTAALTVKSARPGLARASKVRHILLVFAEFGNSWSEVCGNSSVGRAQPCQG